MPKKNIYFVSALMFLLLQFNAEAKNKHKNTIKIHGANFLYLEKVRKGDVKQKMLETAFAVISWQQLGISYERNVYKNLNCAIGYHIWNNLEYTEDPNRKGITKHFMGENDYGKTGLYSRQDHKFIDLSVSYKIKLYKKHQVTVGIGASYQNGEAQYIDSVYYGYKGYSTYSFGHTQTEKYWGYVPSFTYDYIIFRKRAMIGADLRLRKYVNYDYTQIDMGFHVGVTF